MSDKETVELGPATLEKLTNIVCRSVTPTMLKTLCCNTCRFFNSKDDPNNSVCVRYPPVALGLGISVWPHVDINTPICGEFRHFIG